MQRARPRNRALLSPRGEWLSGVTAVGESIHGRRFPHHRLFRHRRLRTNVKRRKPTLTILHAECSVAQPQNTDIHCKTICSRSSRSGTAVASCASEDDEKRAELPLLHVLAGRPSLDSASPFAAPDERMRPGCSIQQATLRSHRLQMCEEMTMTIEPSGTGRRRAARAALLGCALTLRHARAGASCGGGGPLRARRRPSRGPSSRRRP